MKYNQIMLVALVLLAILTIGAVSASEDIVSDELTESVEAGEVQLSSENYVIDVLGDENYTDEGGDENDNPYFIYVNEDEIITDSENEDYDENVFIAGIILPPDTTEGRFNAFVDGEVLFNNDIDGGSGWHNDEAGNLKCHVFLSDMNLGYLYDGAEVEFSFWVGDEKVEEYTQFRNVEVTDTTIRFYYDDEWDGEDGVIINVLNGEDREFDLNDDLDVPFAFISISDNLQGNIRIYIYDDEEDEWYIFFEKSLSEITTREADEENEDFTVYFISLSDFGEKLNDVLDERYFEIGFFEDDDGDLIRIDNRAYNIEYYDDGGPVKFWENFDDDEEEEDDEPNVTIFVDLEKDYPTSGDGDENFIAVTVPNDFEGRVLIFSSKKIFFDKNLTDFESNKVQVVEDEFESYSIYSISLKDVGFFDGLDTFDMIGCDVVDCDVTQILFSAESYRIYFNDDSTFSLLNILDIRIFYGNLTSGETEDGMISFATDKFMDITVPSSSSVDEIDVAVDYGDETITYSLGDFNVEEVSDEELEGKFYYIELNDEIKNRIFQHENQNITFNFSYGFKGKTISASFKRILKDDLFYKINGLSDLYYLFDFNIASDVLNSSEDEAVSIFCFDSNWHLAHNDFGGGIFKVYVNDTYVKSVDLFSQLVHGAPQGVSFSLDDLGISTSGIYTIKITQLPDEEHIEYDEITGELIPHCKLAIENELISKDVVVNFEDDYELIDPELTVEVSDVQYEFEGMIEITVRSLASSVRVHVDGNTYTIALNEDGVGILQILTLNAGNYTVTAISEKTGIYHASEVNETFTVYKAATDINIVADSIGYGEDLVVNVSLPSDVKYRAIVTVDNVSKYVSLKNGIGSVKYSNLDIGSYDVGVSYAGDINYLKASSSVVANVNRGAAKIEIAADDIHEGETLTVTVKLPADVSRRARVTVGDESKLVSLKNGTGTVKFDGLAKGKYDIVAAYDGDEKYLKASASTSVTVTRCLANIEIIAEDINFGEGLTVGVKLPSDVMYRVNVSVGGMSKLVSLKDGVGSVKFSGLAAGTYTVSASYAGDGNYYKSFNTTTVKVNRESTDIKVTVNPSTYSEDAIVDIQMPSDVTRRVSITIANETKLVSLNNGHASVSYKGLTAGTYSVDVSYGGDSNYLKSSVSTTLTVKKATPEIQIVTDDIFAGEDAVINVTLPSDVSRRAVVTVDGESKLVTLHEGNGLVRFTGLSAGAYEVQVSYNGDTNYKSVSSTTVITVKN